MKLLALFFTGLLFTPSPAVIRPPYAIGARALYPNYVSPGVQTKLELFAVSYVRSADVAITIKISAGKTVYFDDVLESQVNSSAWGMELTLPFTAQEQYYSVNYNYHIIGFGSYTGAEFTIRPLRESIQYLPFGMPSSQVYQSEDYGFDLVPLFDSATFTLTNDRTSKIFDLTWITFWSWDPIKYSSCYLYTLQPPQGGKAKYIGIPLEIKLLAKGKYGFNFKYLTYRDENGFIVTGPTVDKGNFQLLALADGQEETHFHLIIEDFFRATYHVEVLLRIYSIMDVFGKCGQINEFCLEAKKGEVVSFDQGRSYEV